jgi:hypothetical protein
MASVVFLIWKILPLGLSLPNSSSERINIAIAGKQVALVSVNRANDSVVVVKVPDDLYLSDLVHGYGQYKASSVYSAGEFDHRGGETLSGTLQEYLGVPVDGYYNSNDDLKNLKSMFLSPGFLFSKNSDVSFWQRIVFIKHLFTTRFDKIKSVNLASFAGPLVLADGSAALTLDRAEVDQVLSGILVENEVQAENLRVEVINTTKVMGLAARVARLLSNLGLTVVNIDGTASQISGCKISVEKSFRKSKTVNRIAKIYNCVVESKEESGRAAVSVFLGTDYVSWLGK